jgi:cytochrome P450
MQEAMRLRPVVPMFFREAMRDTRIRSRARSVLVPQGTILVLHTMAMHHSARHWERPQDFLPVRLMSDAGVALLESTQLDHDMRCGGTEQGGKVCTCMLTLAIANA